MIGFLGLGSNVGDRAAHLSEAFSRLADGGRAGAGVDEAGRSRVGGGVDEGGSAGVVVDVLASSSVYETEPVGLVLDQPEFLNVCLRVSVPDALDPLAFLDQLKGLEGSLGRVPGGVRHGPRMIDIDILLLGSLVLSGERLTLPHPGVVERRFVLVPLLELEPSLALPDGRGLAGVLAGLSDNSQAVRVVGPPLL